MTWGGGGGGATSILRCGICGNNTVIGHYNVVVSG